MLGAFLTLTCVNLGLPLALAVVVAMRELGL